MPQTPDPDDTAAPPPSEEGGVFSGFTRPRRRRWPWIVFATLVLGPVLVIALWSAIAMTYTYSEGDRAGYIQKFSKKGWVCKTWEGEIAVATAPGVMQDRFVFTVRSDSIAEEINRLQGQRVSLHYEEHPGVPLSCFGDTRYFVTGVRRIDDIGVPGSASAPLSPVTPPVAPRRDTIDPSRATP